MNILIVSQNYAPEIGAAPSRLANMAEGLQRSGANVAVLTTLPNYPKGRIFEGYRGRISCREVVNGVDIFRYWIYASISKRAIPRIINMFSFAFTMWLFALRLRVIWRVDYVIVQSPSLPAACSATILFRFLFRKRLILNVSDIWPDTAVELGAMSDKGISYRVMSCMERFIYKHATIIQGQSQEILDHVKRFQPSKPAILYRNLQPEVTSSTHVAIERKPLKIVYAGLLGVAQDVLGIIKQIDFKSLGAEFHMYGGGNQAEEIESFIANREINVYHHGYVDKKDIAKTLAQYHASIVPLTVRIRGAVPSKIFDLMPIGLPILFCGGGEGATMVERYNIGFISEPSDIKALSANIERLVALSDEEYGQLRNNCLEASRLHFSFERQMESYISYLKSNIH